MSTATVGKSQRYYDTGPPECAGGLGGLSGLYPNVLAALYTGAGPQKPCLRYLEDVVGFRWVVVFLGGGLVGMKFYANQEFRCI